MRRTACSYNFSGTYFFEPCFAQCQGYFPSAFGDGQAGVVWEMLAHSDLNYVAFCILFLWEEDLLLDSSTGQQLNALSYNLTSFPFSLGWHSVHAGLSY